MLGIVLLLAAIAASATSPSPIRLDYTLRVDPANRSGFTVELRIRNAPKSLVLAAAAHPEYDDRYWRYITDLRAADARGDALTIVREDSVLWRVSNVEGEVTVQYSLQLPAPEPLRAAWRPFLSPTGGLVGGPHSFLYVLGAEQAAATVTLDLPRGWRVATGLPGGAAARTFNAPDVHTLMESPMLVGVLSEWMFRVKDTPHYVFYWRLPDATAFDTTAFLGSVERLARQTVDLFGSAPYREYVFMFQDGAFGGLEHPNSVTLGAPSADLARDPHAMLLEMAHEFFHSWNLMRIKPMEYRGVDYRTQPPVAGLWFSEGLTLFYADLLVRRAGLPTPQSTRSAHLESLIERYLSNAGNTRFSAEQVSRVAYNAGPGALGDYTASTHLQGELIGVVLDLAVRAATNGARSMDDVMRLMNTRFATRGFTGSDVERAVSDVCSCSVQEIFDGYVHNGNAIDFNRYLAPLGLRTTTSWVRATSNDGQPMRDLRIWGYQPANEQAVRLVISDPNSVWGRAGIQTRDKLISIKGNQVRTWPELRTVLSGLVIGDTVDFVIDRPTGRFETRVVVSGFDRPLVQIQSIPDANEQQRRLRTDWQNGR